MQSARPITLECVFLELRPLEVSSEQFCDKLILLYNCKTIQDIFMKLHTNINQH